MSRSFILVLDFKIIKYDTIKELERLIKNSNSGGKDELIIINET